MAQGWNLGTSDKPSQAREKVRKALYSKILQKRFVRKELIKNREKINQGNEARNKSIDCVETLKSDYYNNVKDPESKPT